jgi:hypothetical protein
MDRNSPGLIVPLMLSKEWEKLLQECLLKTAENLKSCLEKID